ncbi:MAG: hypothetical protein AAGU75_04270 [Bacillota bacterium]
MLKAFERCKKWCAVQRGWLKDYQYERYKLRLLTHKIGLWDVPENLRRDPVYARGIYITGFRADRMVSKERYEKDLLRLDVEISLLKAEDKQPRLLVLLQTLSSNMRYNLSLFDRYNISDFH